MKNMTVVRISNLPSTVSRADMIELVSMVEAPQSIKLEITDEFAECEVCSCSLCFPTSKPQLGLSVFTSLSSARTC